MKRWPALVAVLVVLAAAAGGGAWWWQRAERERDDAALAAVTAYASGWESRDLTRVGFVDPTAAKDFTTTLAGLGKAPVTVTPGAVTRPGTTATSTLDVSWDLGAAKPWTYAVPVQLEEQNGRWLVARPESGSYWNPDIKLGDTISVKRVSGQRGDLLDAGGAALMPMGSVYPVAIDPTRATPQTAAALETIVGEPAGSLVAKLAAATKAGSKAPIAVITYRETDFAARRAALDALKGVIYPKTEQPLAPSRTFGQPLLGTFGEVTAEVVAKSKGRYAAGDRAGLSGLQGQYDAVLAGKSGLKVTSSTGKELFDVPATDGTDVQTTLVANTQAAAEQALAGAGSVPAALVAVDVRTGAVTAIANSPSNGFDRAVTGHYAPGSSFKIASTYAYLTKGITTPTATVACPKTFVVDGKSFRNYEGEELGTPTFQQDFAHSCNTAFVSLAAKLGDDDLTQAGKLLGVGADWGTKFGVTGAFDGSVPAANGKTDKAAASIGQGRVEASPLAMAVLAGSVARGSFIPPVFARPSSEPEAAPAPVALDAPAVAALRSMMAEVVSGGTGSALRGTPGAAVSGKTGTAEFGNDNPPKTRAWFVGYQGDTAFAVLVEEGKSGGSVAAPIAKAFLTALAGG
jgi:cell division protein FtsI/penicillin-binding protein 2